MQINTLFITDGVKYDKYKHRQYVVSWTEGMSGDYIGISLGTLNDATTEYVDAIIGYRSIYWGGSAIDLTIIPYLRNKDLTALVKASSSHPSTTTLYFIIDVFYK